MNKLLLAIFSLLFLITTSLAQQWTPVGNRGISTSASPTIRFDMVDTIPYVAYQDPVNNMKISVKKYDGTNWLFVGAQNFTPATPGPYSSTNRMRFEFKINQNTPYLAFMDNSDSNKVSVMEYTSGSWQYIGQKISPAYGSHLSLAFDGNVPYVAYQSKGGKIQVQKYVTGSWSLVGPADIFPVPGYPSSGRVTSLAILNGTPYLTTYAPTAITTFKTFKFNGTAWVDVSAGDALNPGSYDYHSVVNGGNLYLSFSRFYDASRATLLKYTGTTWDSVGSPGLPFSQDVRVAFGNGTPFLTTNVSLSKPKIYISRYDGTDWKGYGSFYLQNPSGDIVLRFARDTIPFVAYSDGNVGGRITVVRFQNDAPILTTIDSLKGCMDKYPDTIAIHIADEDTNSVELIAQSSNLTLLPNNKLEFLNDTSAIRRLVITPISGQSGVSIIRIIARDNGALTDTVNIKLEVFEQPSVNLEVEDLKCRDDVVGSIEAKPTGQHPPFSYALNGGAFQSDSLFDNLLPGTYHITVSDSNGCEFTTADVLISNPDIIDITSVDVQNERNGNDGELMVFVTGGTGTLRYSLDDINYQLSPVFTGLKAGTYTIYIRDDNNCLKSTIATVGSAVGFNELHSSQMSIFPNPGNGDFVVLRNTAAKSTIVVLNQLGKKVFEQDLFGNKVEIKLPKTLSSGIYFVQLMEAGNVVSKKLQIIR